MNALGHASAELRDAFNASIEAGKVDRSLAHQLQHCTDIMPRSVCDLLDLPIGSAYAQAALVIG
jgi:hypothetical protein